MSDMESIVAKLIREKQAREKNGNEKMSRDMMYEIIKSEGLDEYRKLLFNITGHPEYCAIINRLNDDSYQVDVTGERGNVPFSRSFKTIEEAYAYVIRILRHIKEVFPEDKHFTIETENRTNETGTER